MSSRTSLFRKHSELFFTVGLPRTVCAFVTLTRDYMIEQYINTFLETPRPNVIQTASYCCFEKIRTKRCLNRPIKENGHKIKKTANSDDLLGNMQLKLPIYDWGISILSSKKCQMPVTLADLLGNESFLQRVQKVIVCNL